MRRTLHVENDEANNALLLLRIVYSAQLTARECNICDEMFYIQAGGHKPHIEYLHMRIIIGIVISRYPYTCGIRPLSE